VTTNSVKTVVEVVQEQKTPEDFPGIYESDVAQRCWASDNRRVLLTTDWNSKTVLFLL